MVDNWRRTLMRRTGDWIVSDIVLVDENCLCHHSILIVYWRLKYLKHPIMNWEIPVTYKPLYTLINIYQLAGPCRPTLAKRNSWKTVEEYIRFVYLSSNIPINSRKRHVYCEIGFHGDGIYPKIHHYLRKWRLCCTQASTMTIHQIMGTDISSLSNLAKSYHWIPSVALNDLYVFIVQRRIIQFDLAHSGNLDSYLLYGNVQEIYK